MMADFAELVERFRAALETGSEHRLPPLNPRTTDDEFVAAERALGHALPEDIRELWSVTNGGVSVLNEEFLPVNQFAEETTITKESWSEALAEFVQPDEVGDIPQGDYVVVANGMLAVELDGPAAGRVVWIDLTFMTIPVWRSVAPSLEALARFWVEVAEAGYLSFDRLQGHEYGYPRPRRESTAEIRAIARRHEVSDLV
jgi:hypothetical protein